MTENINILVIENSTTLRNSIASTLTDRDDATVSTAKDDVAEALDVIKNRSTDVIVLGTSPSPKTTTDLIKKIRATDRHLPVILYASIELRAGTTALSALSAGASAHVGRPAATSPQQLADSINTNLMPAVHRWYTATQALRKTRPTTDRPSWKKKVFEAVAAQAESGSIRRSAVRAAEFAARTDGIVVVGSSTGGIDAVKKLLTQLPAGYGKPIVVVQHLLKGFGDMLSEGLQKHCKIPVATAEHGEDLRRGQVYVAPPSRHLQLVAKPNGRISVDLFDGEPVNSCKPAADVLFQSAANIYKGAVNAIVLSGMGQDGLNGCKEISSNGGTILVQNRETCVVWGMPRAVEETGIANAVMTPEAIGRRIAANVSLVPA